MATRMPDSGALMHCASVTYDCTFGGLGSEDGSATFAASQPVQFSFLFEQAQPDQPNPQQDLYVYTVDYSKFDQDTVEAAIASALNGICTDVAQLLGLTTTAVEAAVGVKRTWFMVAIQRGSAAAQQFAAEGNPITETMTYPPAAG
jgi:hypothetical protein